MRRVVLLTIVWLLRPILSVESAVAADVSPSLDCCVALTAALGSSKVVYPVDEPYRSAIASYWTSQARDTKPTCVLLARSSQDVAEAVKTLSYGRRCRFAIRSGGHKPWPDSANIEDGVTIDLSALNEVRLSGDRNIASIGPGARWIDVYQTLEPLGVAVVGGRNGVVGVGGLVIGGGISLFTGRYGFACDSVMNFEVSIFLLAMMIAQVVLASGEMIDANAQNRSDLFQALKGGSNNFGIVTRLDLNAFEQGPLWGGNVIYPDETLRQHIPAVVRFTDALAQYPYAHLLLFETYSSATNQTTILNVYIYTKPESFPPPFKELIAIEPAIESTLRIVNLTEVTNVPYSGVSGRGFEGSVTLANRPSVIARSFEISAAMLEPLKGRRNLTWSTGLQPIPRLYSDLSVERGGNVLGLDRNPGNYILFLITLGWDDPADDEDIYAAATATIEKVDRYSKKVGAGNDWIYLNYALQNQDVITSYGPENVKKLHAVSQKYDPGQVFQKLVPGGYKIPAAPKKDEIDEVDPSRGNRGYFRQAKEKYGAYFV